MQAVSTIVLVQSATKAHCSVERLLRALHLSRADLVVHGGILHYQPLTHRECCTTGEVGPAPSSHTLHVWWHRAAADEGEQDDEGMLVDSGEGDGVCADDAEPPPPCRTPCPLGGAVQVKVAISLDPRLLLGDGEKKQTWGWTRTTVHKILQEFVSPCDPSSYPMQEAGMHRGSGVRHMWCFPLCKPRLSSGPAASTRGSPAPWMQGGDSRVPGWDALGAPARLRQGPIPDLWAKLASDPQISGQFGGLVPGDQEGRVGVRLFGA